MSFFQAIVLGIVQGLTEFLPISSSAHLVLVPYLLNWSLDANQAFVFDVLVQLGTLVAVFIYFWKDIVHILHDMFSGLKEHNFKEKPEGRLGWLIVLATIPAGLAGLLLKDKVEAAFNSPLLTGSMLLVTSTLLIIGEMLSKKSRTAEAMTPLDDNHRGAFPSTFYLSGHLSFRGNHHWRFIAQFQARRCCACILPYGYPHHAGCWLARHARFACHPCACQLLARRDRRLYCCSRRRLFCHPLVYGLFTSEKPLSLCNLLFCTSTCYHYCELCPLSPG